MSGVVSATDHFTELALGRAGFLRLVRSRAIETHSPHGERPSVDLEAELDIRGRRLAELREFAVRRRRVEELMGLPGYTTSSATPTPTPSAHPASVARSPCTRPEHASRPCSTVRSQASDPWTVALRVNARPRFTIHLDGDTARQILAEVGAAAPDGVETGGYLFARFPADDSDVRVVYTTGAGAGSRHGRRSMALAAEADVRRELIPDWLDGDDLLRVGDWHYHPTSGASRPSKPDVRAWASYLRRDDRRYTFAYPAIIAIPGGASGPSLQGWVTRSARTGHYVCEPANVLDRLGYCR